MTQPGSCSIAEELSQEKEREIVEKWWRENHGFLVRKVLPPGFPTIVCLCGSTKFKSEFIKANFDESLAGKIVLSVGWFSHADSTVYSLNAEEKRRADELYFRKIELADEVLILNVGGYIGESTKNELAYAMKLGKKIRFLEPV